MLALPNGGRQVAIRQASRQPSLTMFEWLTKFFGRRAVAPPKAGELRQVERDRHVLGERREKLLYEALERDDEIQRLYKEYKATDRDLLKKELLRTLTIKKAEYESLMARLERLGEAAVANTRRSAFLQSFLDLPQVTEEDLTRLESLQNVRREQERRSAMFADRVIELTEMSPETSIEAQRLQQETLEALQAQDRRQQAAAEAAPRPLPAEVERKLEEALERTAQSMPADAKSAQADVATEEAR